MNIQCIFDLTTKRGKDFDRSPGPGEFAKNLDISEIGWFRSTPSRYQFNVVFSEFPGWESEQMSKDVQAAVGRKAKEIEAKCAELQSMNFAWGGHVFYCDADDRDRNIPATALTSMILPDADPIPTGEPYPGCWVSAIDEAGNRTPVPFTCSEFREFALAVYRRTSALWGKEKIHLATLAAMVEAGARAEQIEAYDVYSGW